MENPDPDNPTQRDYSSISPSARALLFVKGLTDIPFAKEAAELMLYPEAYQPDIYNKDIGFWARVLHFEHRYKSINQLLEGLPVKNILELSSGFSFRGLDAVQQRKVHYIDTDLQNIIDVKKDFITALKADLPEPAGKLEVLPLNALDENAFDAITARFDEGPLAIVNEGLLVYLDMAEKERLLKIVHQLLKRRGGYWITADIYIKTKAENQRLQINDELNEFFLQHRIEENKFDSFEAAEAFFNKAGFVIDKVAEPDHSKMTSMYHLLKNTSLEQLRNLSRGGKIQATWRLKPAD